MKLLIPAILFLGFSQVSRADVYEMTFNRVALLANEQACQSFVKDAAQELARQSGANIIDSGCRSDRYSLSGWDGVITYQSSSRLAVTSTDTNSVYSTAFFSVRSECEATLEQQKEQFVNATGLQPLVAYCALDVGRENWATRVDGLGQAEFKPNATGLIYWGVLVNEEATLSDLENAAAGYGISAFETGVYRGGLGNEIVLRYYAHTPYVIADYHSMTYKTAEACTDAAAAVESFLTTEKPVVVFCEARSAREEATLHVVSLENALDSVPVFATVTLPTRYTTFDACHQAAAGIGQSSDVYGAVCAGGGESFRIHMFIHSSISN